MELQDLRSAKLPGPRVAFLLGLTGSGKTEVSRKRFDAFDRAIALDVQRKDGSGEYWGRLVHSPGELADVLEEYAGKPRWKICYRGPMEFPVDPKKPDGAKTSEPLFDALADIDNYLLVVEEAELFMTASDCPRGIFRMARQGRRFGQALTLCAHRPQDVARKLTAVAAEICVWAGLFEPEDFKVVKARGFDETIYKTLKWHQSIRRVQESKDVARFYICRCGQEEIHDGPCGEPLPLAPVAVGAPA